MLILLVALVGLAAAHQPYVSLDLENVSATDEVIYVNGTFSYTLYAKSLAEEELVEHDEAFNGARATTDPNVAEDARINGKCKLE